jgi:hypothetical protein
LVSHRLSPPFKLLRTYYLSEGKQVNARKKDTLHWPSETMHHEESPLGTKRLSVPYLREQVLT